MASHDDAAGSQQDGSRENDDTEARRSRERRNSLQPSLDSLRPADAVLRIPNQREGESLTQLASRLDMESGKDAKGTADADARTPGWLSMAPAGGQPARERRSGASLSTSDAGRRRSRASTDNLENLPPRLPLRFMQPPPQPPPTAPPPSLSLRRSLSQQAPLPPPPFAGFASNSEVTGANDALLYRAAELKPDDGDIGAGAADVDARPPEVETAAAATYDCKQCPACLAEARRVASKAAAETQSSGNGGRPAIRTVCQISPVDSESEKHLEWKLDRPRKLSAKDKSPSRQRTRRRRSELLRRGRPGLFDDLLVWPAISEDVAECSPQRWSSELSSTLPLSEAADAVVVTRLTCESEGGSDVDITGMASRMDVDAGEILRRATSEPDLRDFASAAAAVPPVVAAGRDSVTSVPGDGGTGGSAEGSSIRQDGPPTAVKKQVRKPPRKSCPVAAADRNLATAISSVGAAGDVQTAPVTVSVETGGSAVGNEMQQDSVVAPTKKQVHQPCRKSCAVASADGYLAATVQSVDTADDGQMVHAPCDADTGIRNDGNKMPHDSEPTAAKKCGRPARRVSAEDADGNSATAIAPPADAADAGKGPTVPADMDTGCTAASDLPHDGSLAAAKKPARKPRRKCGVVVNADGNLAAIVAPVGEDGDGKVVSVPVGVETGVSAGGTAMRQAGNAVPAKKPARQPRRKSGAVAKADGDLAAIVSPVGADGDGKMVSGPVDMGTGDVAAGIEMPPQEGALAPAKKPVRKPFRKSFSIASADRNLASSVPSIDTADDGGSVSVPAGADTGGRAGGSETPQGGVPTAAKKRGRPPRRTRSAVQDQAVGESGTWQDGEPPAKKPRGRPRLSTSVPEAQTRPADDGQAVAKKRRSSVVPAFGDVASGEAQVGAAGAGKRRRTSSVASNVDRSSSGPSETGRRSVAVQTAAYDDAVGEASEVVCVLPAEEPAKRPYRKKTQQQLAELVSLYEITSNPSDEQCADVAQRTGLTVADVKRWCSGKRYRERQKEAKLEAAPGQ